MKKLFQFLSLFACIISSCHSNNPAMEKEKILTVINKMYNETDKKNWPAVQSVFTDSVLMDYSSVEGSGTASHFTPGQITHRWSGFDSVRHIISNIKIKPNGNEALATLTGHTSHYFNNKSWIVDADYEIGLKKIDSNWLINSYKIILKKQVGDTTLGKEAAEKQKSMQANAGLAIKKEEINIPVNGSPMQVHIAYPDSVGKYPAVIVVMELFGVNDNIRDITNKIAALGYVAIAPDFYHRTKKPGDISYGDDGRKYGFEQLNQLKRKTVLEDAKATISFLQSRPDVSPKMGIVGFSMGGHIAYLTATQFNFRAIGCFYGGWLTNTEIPLSQPEPTITFTPGISKHDSKLIYFAGANDAHITKAQLDSMETVWKQDKLSYQLIVYPNVSHGFFCDQRPEDYNAAAHDDAWQKLQQLFSETLK